MNFIKTQKKGFSLLELTIVLIITTILASSAVPFFVRSFVEKASEKTALDISAIEEASRAYYVNNNKWPDASVYATPIAALQAGNYLPAAWSAKNPFGNDYTVTSVSNMLTVSTTVRDGSQTLITSRLPTSSSSTTTVTSSIPVPGQLAQTPAGSVIPWASSTLPTGYLWANGSNVSRSTYANLYSVIGTTYGAGDGTTTFTLPDMRGRTIVGIDAMGGSSFVNRITSWGTLPNNYGGTFGEDTHRQTVTQMAPHTHHKTIYRGGLNGGGNLASWNDSYNGSGDGWVDSAGGNGDGSGLGAPSNVVQPSMAMGYIIKY